MRLNPTRRQSLRWAASAATATIVGALPMGIGSSRAHAIDPIARSGKGRLKVSLAAYSLRRQLDLKNPQLTLDGFLERCAEWGADGAELTEYYFPRPITPTLITGLKRKAFLLGLDITGTPVGNNFVRPPGAERDREVEGLRRWIDISADLGSPAIRIFAGNATRGVDEAEARRWVVECIEECCERAAQRGVFLAIENHGGVVARADGLLEIVKAVACPWVGVNLDTGNFHTPDPYADLERCAPYAVTCQLKTEVTPEGKAKEAADVPRIVAILRKAGYEGYVTLEHEADEDPLEAIPRHLEALRKAIAG